jgi:hypothetical protein
MYSYDRRPDTIAEYTRRLAWLEAQGLKAAADISNSAWERGIDALIDETQSMKKQVDRFGGIQNALGQGHGTTLKQQMSEVAAILRTLQRRLGE